MHQPITKSENYIRRAKNHGCNSMRKIEMVDLKSQYQKIKPDIDKGIQ